MSVHDLWGGAKTGPGRQYEVRWRAGGRQRKKRFRTKTEAKKFDEKQRVDPDAPSSRRSPWTVEQMLRAWLGTVSVRASTMRAYELEVAHLTKAFGDAQASQVKPSEVRAWLARTEPGVSIRRRCLVTLRRAYALALADGLVQRDPTVGARPPRQEQADPQFLTWEALGRLAKCAGPDAPLIWLLGTGGLRPSEAIALDRDDVKRDRGRVRVRKSKTAAGVREVPLAAEVLALLPDYPGPVFKGQNGGRLNFHNWRERRFREIAREAGLSPAFTPYKLRHTAASLAIAAGADAKTVALMLGHADPGITLRTYQHLFDSQLDEVARRMSEARRATLDRLALDAGSAAPRGLAG